AQASTRVPARRPALYRRASSDIFAAVYPAGRRGIRPICRLWHHTDRRRSYGPRAVGRRVRRAPGALYPLAATTPGQSYPRRLAPTADLSAPGVRPLDHLAAIYGER